MGHHHEHESLRGKKLFYAILLNALITLAQVIGGLFSGSMALLSDALHNLSDVIALFTTYIAEKVSKKKCSCKSTFGYKRAQIIAPFIDAALLIVIGLFLFKEGLVRLFHPVEIQSFIVIALAFFSIIVNGLCVFLLENDSKESLNVRSAYLHLFTDMLTSIAVLVGGFLIYFFQLYWVDALITMGISIYLIIASVSLLLDTLYILMQFTPSDIDIYEIVDKILNLNPIISNVHHIHVWQLTDHNVHFEAHLDFKKDVRLSEVSKILMEIEQKLIEENLVAHISFQPEYGIRDNKNMIVEDE